MLPLIAENVEDMGSVATMPSFDTALTAGALAAAPTPVECPPVDGALLELYFNFMIRARFLPPPPTDAALSAVVGAADEEASGDDEDEDDVEAAA